MNDTLRRLLPAVAVVAASPAFACGGPRFTEAQMGLLTVSVATAPLLAAFLVDRGAFALGAYAMDLQRRHTPTVFGPLLAFAAIAVSFFGAHARNIELATVGFALIPVAALVCGLSFVRSVVIDLRGQRSAQILRIAAVVGFGVMAMVRFAL